MIEIDGIVYAKNPLPELIRVLYVKHLKTINCY